MGHRIRGHRFGCVGDFAGNLLGYYALSDYGTLVMSIKEGLHYGVRDEFPGKQLAVPYLEHFDTMTDCLCIEGDRFFRGLLFSRVDDIDMYDVWVADSYNRHYLHQLEGILKPTLKGVERKDELRKAFELNKRMKQKKGWTYGRLQDSFRMYNRYTAPQLDALFAILGFTINQRLCFNQQEVASMGIVHIARLKASLDLQTPKHGRKA